MNNSDDEYLTDTVIGEAILSLLLENGPVSTRALIARLQSMATAESDPARRAIMADVIADISNNNMANMIRTTRARKNRPVNKNNVYPLFVNDQPPGGGKKH
ncbi:hypothetical protein [Dryocola sp. BD613]|uniref:hypothetical protein n=1 Tax=Dryocola sp. BD613 TaxID=3133272 RepID=UPI003F4F5413